MSWKTSPCDEMHNISSLKEKMYLKLFTNGPTEHNLKRLKLGLYECIDPSV